MRTSIIGGKDMDNHLNIHYLDQCTGEYFEDAIVQILETQGYTQLSKTPKASDFGADILGNLNEVKYAIQVKRAVSAIGISAVQQALGGMLYYEAQKGIIITNSIYSASAVKLAEKAPIELIDRHKLKILLSKVKLESKTTITPLKYQKEGLDNLISLRHAGQNRALAIMASGLGKTYLSAFDAFNFQRYLGTPIKALYLSHQGVILDQAKRSFLNIFGIARTYGRFDSECHDRCTDITFATFQSMFNALETFDPFEFDYVVVDEAHHTAAPTRDKVVTYFKPKFLLGLTATPIRGDGKDIYAYYHDNIAISLPLEVALVDGLLTPIIYKTLSDNVDTNELYMALSNLEGLDLDSLFTPRTDHEIVEIILKESAANSANPKIIIFCSSLIQMYHFATLFKNCKTISGEDSRKQQIEIVEGFKLGHFNILLARDVLNEGIDIPDASVLVFLRNTESSLVFFQQLGRGLRKDAGKDKVLVLDFVNNLERFDFIYGFFSRISTLEKSRRGKSTTPNQSVFDLQMDALTEEVFQILIDKKVKSGYWVGFDAIVSSLDNKVTVLTLKHLVEIGKLEPDYLIPDKNGKIKEYLEQYTLNRFFRYVYAKRHSEGMIHERTFAHYLGHSPKWLHDQEKFYNIQPSWIHKNSRGKLEFYYTEDDINKYKHYKQNDNNISNSPNQQT